jgi:UDP-glucose 4-epimerase
MKIVVIGGTGLIPSKVVACLHEEDHDFMMLNPLSGTHATRAAVAQATSILRDVLHSA